MVRYMILGSTTTDRSLSNAKILLAAFPAVCALLSQSVAQAQRGVGDWTTGGFDAQRSHWVRNDAKISVESMRKPGFALDWKLNLNDILG